MVINSLKLVNFRSYKEQRFELGKGITVVVGPNASGKTNLLEAIYVLAITKSFRAKDPALVAHNQDFFRIEAASAATDLSFGYGLIDGSLVKRVSHGGVKRSLVQHIGTVGVTLFEPNDLLLLSGAPSGRRGYLDSILSQTDREYFKTLAEYRRVLKQRNSLLDGFDESQIRSQIFAWDVKLTAAAAKLYEARLALIEYLNTAIPVHYGDIAGEQLDFALSYAASVDTTDYAASFLKALETNLARDMAIGFTTIGPHREDFKVAFRNNEITNLASRGEARTAVLAMKLAEIAYMEQHLDTKPILLLDDVFSELDSSRRAFLVSRLTGYQTIITTTDADHILADIPTDYKRIETSLNHE